MLLAGWQIARTPFVADLSAFLPASPDAGQRLLIDQLKSGLPARTLMLGIDGGSAAERADASRRLGDALRRSGLFEQVQNGDRGAGDDWNAIGTWIFERRYQLSPAVDADRFTSAGLADAIGETVSLLGTPAGNGLKDILDRDPTGETQRIAESMIPATAPRSEAGVWVARQAPRALLLVVVQAAGADLDGQLAAMQRIGAAFRDLAAPGLTLKMSGAPVFSVDSRARIEHEVKWLAITGTLLMSTLLLLAFASPTALAVAMLPVATGVVGGIAAVALGFGSVHGITLGFGSTLIGESVDYAIYYLIQARGQGGNGWRQWLASGWPTVRLGLLTSVCGFAALAFSGFPGLAQLGVFSVAGLVTAALATRFVLPVLMPDGARGMGLRRQLGRFAARGLVLLPATRRIWLVLGAAAVVLLLGRGGLWKADLASLSPVPQAAIELDQQLRADLRSADAGALVVVQGESAEQTLQRAEAASARLEPLVEQRVIAGFDSISRLLPSVATQQRRTAALPGAEVLRTQLREATKGGPLGYDRLAPFVGEVEAAKRRQPDTPAGVKGTPLAPLVNALLFEHSGGGWTALLPLQPVGEQAIDGAAVGAALQGVPSARLLDIKDELDRLYDHYLGEARAQALFGALGVVLLIAVTLRSLPRVLAVCQPLLLAVLLTLGLLAAFGVRLGILHLVGLLLVVAVGSNYALFFDLLRGQDHPDDDTLASLLLANVTTVLSFGLIALSQIPALSAIGRVVAPGALLAIVLSAAFAPRRRPDTV
jgi:predicted exporter